jgi:hypothetical protein
LSLGYLSSSWLWLNRKRRELITVLAWLIDPNYQGQNVLPLHNGDEEESVCLECKRYFMVSFHFLQKWKFWIGLPGKQLWPGCLLRTKNIWNWQQKKIVTNTNIHYDHETNYQNKNCDCHEHFLLILMNTSLCTYSKNFVFSLLLFPFTYPLKYKIYWLYIIVLELWDIRRRVKSLTDFHSSGEICTQDHCIVLEICYYLHLEIKYDSLRKCIWVPS